MQIKDVRPESFTKQICCDRCGLTSELGEVEFHESVCIELKAGYASIFGDGNDIQIDLCQHCLKSTLGPWLRVSEPNKGKELLAERLRLFDPDRHGGEFPMSDAGSQARTLTHDSISRSEAAGGEIPTEVDLAKMSAKVAAARPRTTIGVLKEHLDVPADFDNPLPEHLNQSFEGDPEQALRSLAADVFETEVEAEAWLFRPHPMLEGQAPLEHAMTSEGARHVIHILMAIKHGGVV